MIRALAPFLIFMLVPVTSLAATSNQNYAVQGVGRIACEQFLAERESGSKLYWNIGGWIDGFLTGYNAYVPNTYDITPHAPHDSADSFVVLLTRHCASNRQDPIGMIVRALAEQMHSFRIQQVTEATEVEVAGETYVIYPNVIARIQEILRDKGLYDGAVDSAYGPELRNALQRFQKQQGIGGNGAPTQDTILRLLFVRGAKEQN